MMEHEVTYSSEQKAIIDLASPPNAKETYPIVRVTAAAGTGKTTTLMGYSDRLIELQHNRITYVTFSKSAVVDASKRLNPIISCKTIHGIALGLLDLEEVKPEDDSKLDDYILDMYEEKILGMLSTVAMYVRNDKKNPMPTYMRLVAFYIRKTLTRFLQSADSIEKGLDPHNKYNTYYPAAQWHGKQAIKGLPKFAGSFYIKMATQLYEDINSGKLRKIPFDFIIKKAQLDMLQIPCDVLLVDESQDCTACQIDWLSGQKMFGRQIVFVGDTCQTIYGFRGAKSTFLMGLHDCVDRSLTHSYRFGKEIASIANTILFVKENSPQTIGKRIKTWIPYRVIGKKTGVGIICSDRSKFPHDEQVTIVGRTNLSLLKKALELLLQDPAIKVAILGKGSSGMNKWNKTLKEMKDLFELFTGKIKSLDHWPMFQHDGIATWDTFLEVVRARELGTYVLHIGLINTYEEGTLKVLDNFKKSILDKKYSLDEANYLLTTVHAAKGLEWDNVEILDDFMELAKYEKSISSNTVACIFDLKDWGDDLNLWYVAVTRSRKFLHLPEKFSKLVGSFKYVLSNHANMDEDMLGDLREYLGKEKGFPESLLDFEILHRTLICKWKKEIGDQLHSLVDLGDIDMIYEVKSSESHTSEKTLDSISLHNDSHIYDASVAIMSQNTIESSASQNSQKRKYVF